jgi:FkbM family methyltransferase
MVLVQEVQMIKDYSFRGKIFKAEDNVSFEDETEVREAWWGVGEGDCVFDIGASYGSYSLTGLAAGAKQVFAWEPRHSSLAYRYSDLFKTSIISNGWQNKVVLYDYGLYDKTGWVGTQTYFPPNSKEKTIWHEIEVRPMDEWYQTSFIPNFGREEFNRFWMKVDVEGAEVEVLKGAKELISALSPILLVECHPYMKATLQQEVIEYVSSFGFYNQIYSVPYRNVSHSLFVPANESFVPKERT